MILARVSALAADAELPDQVVDELKRVLVTATSQTQAMMLLNMLAIYVLSDRVISWSTR